MPTLDDERISRKLYEDLKAQAIGVAKIRGMAPGQKQATAEEERLLFMQEADGWTVEKELALLTGLDPMTGLPIVDPQTGQPSKPKSREAVGLEKYPHRQKLAASGERAISKYQQSKYLADMARKVDPSWAPTPTPKDPPPPALPTTDTPEMGGLT